MRQRITTQCAQHGKAVHARQHDVEKDQVGAFLARHVDRRFAIGGLEHHVAVLRQHLAQHGADGGRIVHHQHPGCLGYAAAWHRAALRLPSVSEETPDQFETAMTGSPLFIRTRLVSAQWRPAQA
jgi:hypothetical protein